MILIPIIIQNHLSGSITDFGIIESILALGTFVAATILLPQLNKIIPKSFICTVGAFFCGIGIFIASFDLNLLGFSVSVFLIGAGIAIFTMNGQSHRILAIPQNKRARILSIDLSIGQLTKAIGLSLVGLLTTFIDIKSICLSFGLIIMFMSFMLLCIPNWKAFMSLNHDQLEGYYEKQYLKTLNRDRSMQS